jgi:hypothetical protein
MSFFNKKIFLIFLILKISYQNFNLNKFSLNSNMKSKLTNKEKEKYENFLTQEKSFKQSLNFLSINFEPELKNYWNSLNKLILKFFIVSIFPLSFIIFYLILRFIFNKCQKPNKISRFYRNFTWIFLLFSIISVFITFTIIIVNSIKSNNSINSSFKNAQKQLKNFNNFYNNLNSFINKQNSTILPNEKLMKSFYNSLNNDLKNEQKNTKNTLNNENTRNLLTIFLYLITILIFIISIILYMLKKEKFLMFLSIFTLFLIPILIIFAGFTAKFYFFYCDLCQSVNGAIYKNEFPVTKKGLGYYFNCLDLKTKSSLFSINYQFLLFKDSISDEKIKNETEKIINENINPLLNCSLVYNIIPQIEYEFCKNGMENFSDLITLFLWLMLFVFFLFLSIRRLEILVWKKHVEIEEIMENEEAMY